MGNLTKTDVKKQLFHHIENNLSLYTFTTILIFIGIFFGAIIVNSLNIEQKNDLYLYLTRFFKQMTNEPGMSASDLFNQSFSHYLKYIGFIWILGISVIGLPIILILLFLKGIVIGFTVGFLVSQMGIKGFFLALVSVLPQNLILIPTFIIVGVASISFSLRMIRMQFKKTQPFAPLFVKYSLLMVGVIGLIVLSSSIEAWISPFLMKTVIKFSI